MGRAKRLGPALALAVALTVVSAPVTHADEPDPAEEPTAQNRRRAKQLYDLGKRLFAAKEFAEAARTFAESFDFDPRPGALFNQGRCHEEAGNKKRAISAFKRYLVLDPGGDAAEEARTRTLALERKLELEGKLPDGQTNDDKGREHREGRSLRVAGIVTGGAGVVLFITGATFGLKARSIASELEDREPGQWTDAELARFDDGERAETVGITLMSLGAAAAITGGVLYYLGDKRGRERSVELTPQVGPTEVGASLKLRF